MQLNLDKPEKPQQTNEIRVSYGANNQTLTLMDGEELTVGKVREDLRDLLNVPPNSICVVSGEAVDDDRRLKSGDTVEFIKQSGTKA